jgi:hypothetical protein
VFAASLALAVAVVSGCSGTEVKDQERRETDVYSAVLRTAIVGLAGGGAQPLVYVSPLNGAKPFPLDVQAGVIHGLSKQAQVKFVDEQAEAIDSRAHDMAVLGAGTLFSLGPVAPLGTTMEVNGERYRTAADRATLRFTVRDANGVWAAQLAAEQPEPPAP